MTKCGFLLLPMFVVVSAAGQVVTIDSTGNLTSNGSYSSGTGGGTAGSVKLNGSTSGVFGIAVQTTPATHNWLLKNSSTPTTGQIPIFTAPDGSNNALLTYGSILGTAGLVTVTPTASSVTITLPANAVQNNIGSQAANLVYASPNGSSGLMNARALVKADLPGTTVSTDQSNSFTAGTQDFSAATSLKVPVSGGAAPTANARLPTTPASESIRRVRGLEPANRRLGWFGPWRRSSGPVTRLRAPRSGRPRPPLRRNTRFRPTSLSPTRQSRFP